jgi:hypothetical protein
MKEHLDIATRHASGEEAVGVVFMQNIGKAAPGGGRGTPITTTNKGRKRGVKSDKRVPRRRPQPVMVTTSCGEDNNGRDADDSDEELVAATERDFKRQARLPADHFEKLLEVTCPNHTYPAKHKLKECTMMENYMTKGNLAKSKKHEGNSAGKAVAPFPEEKTIMSIYGGPTPRESRRKLKLTGGVINSVSVLVPECLRWS